MSYTILTGSPAFASMRNTTNTKLLIHSDTTDGSTTFADSSTSGHTVDVGAADVAHDTAQKKFGASSILFDGDSGYLSIDDHADWYMGTGAFTVDFWVRHEDVAAGDDHIYFSQHTDGSNEMVFFYDRSIGGGSFSWYFEAGAGATSSIQVIGAYNGLTANQWYHIALIRGWAGNSDNWAITVDGIAITTEIDSDECTNLTNTFNIGYNSTDVAMQRDYLNGWIDEFRVVKGEAMWTTQFTPPIGPYT